MKLGGGRRLLLLLLMVAVVRSSRWLQTPIGAQWGRAVRAESERLCRSRQRGELGTGSAQALAEERLGLQLSIGSGGRAAHPSLPARRLPPASPPPPHTLRSPAAPLLPTSQPGGQI